MANRHIDTKQDLLLLSNKETKYGLDSILKTYQIRSEQKQYNQLRSLFHIKQVVHKRTIQ